MRPHLPEEELHSWLDGQLSQAQSTEIVDHLLSCLICRAAEAEARGLKERTAALLAIAAPDTIKGLPLPTPVLRLRWGRLAGIAAAAGLVVISSWSVGSSSGTLELQKPSLMVTTRVAPLEARYLRPLTEQVAVELSVPQPAVKPRSRILTLASKAAITPRVAARNDISLISSQRLRMVDPMADMAPPTGNNGEGWQTSSFKEAEESTGGKLPHLDGLEVSAVRLQVSSVGGRPTAMVRQLLPDGRALWVVEGALEELDHVYTMLDASGLSFSTPRRVRPDYIGPDSAPVRTTRMVTVASYLPIDSLNGLAEGRLKY